MVNKFDEEPLSKSIDELREIIEGTNFDVGIFIMNYAHLSQCPKLQMFLIHATQTHCPHLVHGIILGMLIIKNQEEYNTTKELEKLFNLEKKND